MRVWVCELKLLHLSRNVPLIKNQETTGSHHVFFTVYCSGLVLKTSSPTWRSSNAWRHEGSDRVTLAILVTLPMIGDPFLVTCFRDLIVFVFFFFFVEGCLWTKPSVGLACHERLHPLTQPDPSVPILVVLRSKKSVSLRAGLPEKRGAKFLLDCAS